VLAAVAAVDGADLAGRVVLAVRVDDVEDSSSLPPPTTAGTLERVFAELTGSLETGYDAPPPLLATAPVQVWQGPVGGTHLHERGPLPRYYLPRKDADATPEHHALGRLLAHCLAQPFAVPPVFPPLFYRWLAAAPGTLPTVSLADLDLVDPEAAQTLRVQLAQGAVTLSSSTVCGEFSEAGARRGCILLTAASQRNG